MNYVENRSLAGRALAMLADARDHGRLTEAEERVVLDVIWHPDFPDFLKQPESLPTVSRKGAAPAALPDDQPLTTYRV